jgi:hypothetical protein
MRHALVVDHARQKLRDALDTRYAADAACACALEHRAAFNISDETAPVEHLLKIYSRRVEHLRERGARTVGSDDFIVRLATADGPLRLASVDNDEYHFVVFLDAETGRVVSARGVEARAPVDPA